MPVDIVLGAFQSLFPTVLKEITRIGVDVPIPQFNEEIVIKVINDSIKILQAEPTIDFISPPVFVVGDLHGSLHDLLRILATNGISSDKKYLFLGDYVDRGSFSLEVMLLLLSLKCTFPNNFFLLRGNHECLDVCSVYGFKTEILNCYNSSIFNKFIELFEYLPMAAVIDNSIFCVHGGISPVFKSLSQLEAIQKPISDVSDSLLKNLLWSDPTNSEVMFIDSDRAGCYCYGHRAVLSFLGYNNLLKMFRAHQCMQKGVFWHSDKLATVFSSSFYSSNNPNQSGIVYVQSGSATKDIRYPPIKKIPREMASFFTLAMPRVSTHRNLSLLLKPIRSKGNRSLPPQFKTGHTNNSDKEKKKRLNLLPKLPRSELFDRRLTHCLPLISEDPPDSNLIDECP